MTIALSLIELFQMLESRWVTSSGDIMTFRKALLNPITSLQFRRYISIKGDSLENDVLFWQEVQKYKVSFDISNADSRDLCNARKLCQWFDGDQVFGMTGQNGVLGKTTHLLREGTNILTDACLKRSSCQQKMMSGTPL